MLGQVSIILPPPAGVVGLRRGRDHVSDLVFPGQMSPLLRDERRLYGIDNSTSLI